MVLHPCVACGRHVEIEEARCPFCGAACTRFEPRPVRAGRLARAVVFAGATLAACDQGKGATDRAVDKPTDPQVAKQPVAEPRVHGTITDDAGGPLVGAQVSLNGPAVYTAVSDHKGRYAFDDIATGQYKLIVGYMGMRGGEWAIGNAEHEVHVASGAEVRQDVSVHVQREAPAMPYGAPPARRRVV
jgi:hypothetical protein